MIEAAPAWIGRYRVLSVLGRGAMGVVYKAIDETLDRDVAIKVMSNAHLEDPESRARFLREARAAGRLQHPNIITIYELGEHGDSPFMAMEHLEGVDLQQAIKAGLRPDPRTTLPIVLQVLAGLNQAHEHGIVHRDIKPSNIFLPRGRPAKIMDFGVARLGAGLTTAGAMVGTPNYMSPEQVNGRATDGRSDLFSTGLILFELVTGEKAYQADSIVTLLYQISQGPPDLSLLPRAREWAQLRAVLHRALAHDVAARYPDAASMQADLQAALDQLGGPAVVSSATDRRILGMGRGSGISTEQRPVAPMPPMPPPPRPVAFEPDDDGPGETVSMAAPETRRSAAPPPRRSNAPIIAASLLAFATVALVAYGVVLAMRPGAQGAIAPPAVATPKSAASTLVGPSALPPATLAGRVRSAPTVVARTEPEPAPPAPTILESTAPPSSTAPRARPSPPLSTPSAASLETSLERANDLLERGRYGSAMAEARAILRRDPGNRQAQTILEDAEAAQVVETRLRQAQAAMRKGNRAAALEHVRVGLAVAPSDARLLALFRQLQ